MNKPFSSRTSETDWERVIAMSDEDIDLSEIPEATAEQVARATFRIGQVPVERKQESVQIMIDGFILDYFRAKAGDRDYRALVNVALAEYMMGHPLPEEKVS
ncbi:MAG: BrnA antitoxin family protein [Alkalinema sp. RU_4_3]|nr:BrnA antitoxin family protein [Alkalinema sp. RU_4_3]